MCLNGDNSDQAEWYKKIKAKMGRLIHQRKVHESTSAEANADVEHEVFHVHVKALCLALGKANSAEAARRKLAIKTLWVLCGRGGEPALLAYESMRWNALLDCVSGESDQSKTSKTKYFCFIAGVDHLSDWAIDFGDALVWEKGNRKFNADTKTWLLPDLYAAKSSTTTITDYMKAMQAPGLPGSLQKYQDYAITHDKFGVELPPAPTAKGMRHGACETICIGVPAELAVHVTGHDLTSVGALFNYLNARVALCIPGALLLAGWPGLPYGQTGNGSKYPSLETLVKGGVSMKRLEAMIDELFGFHDFSPPMLLSDGQLRPLMHVTLATMIMYYETRFKSKESEHVLARMRDAYDAKISTPGFAAHQVLIEWGDALKIQFKLDNAHLFNRKGHDLSEQVVAGLQGLGGNVARMSAQISDLATRTISLEHQNSVLLQQMQQMMRIIAQQQQLLLARPPVVDGPSPQLPPLPPLAPLAPAPVITPLAGSPEGRQFMHAAATAELNVTSATASGALGRDLGGHSAGYELADKLASAFFLDCMDNSGNVPVLSDGARRKKECEGVLSALKAMANRDEMAVLTLKERDQSSQAHAVSIAGEVVILLVRRLLREYADKGDDKTPGRLATGKVFVNTLDKHLKSSKLNVCSRAFAAWRQDPEAPIVGPMKSMFAKRARSPSPNEDA